MESLPRLDKVLHWANIITSTKYYTTPLKIERNMLGRFIDEKYVCNLYKNVILPGCTFTFRIVSYFLLSFFVAAATTCCMCSSSRKFALAIPKLHDANFIIPVSPVPVANCLASSKNRAA